MSRFQGTNLPSGLKDRDTETQVRKMGLDLLSKINSVSSDMSGSQGNLGFKIDARSTSGGTRTETVIDLEIGEIAIIMWQLIRTSGSVTFALPNSGNEYEVFIPQGTFTGSTNILGAASGTGAVMSGGSCVGGSSFVLFSSSLAMSLFGYVKRIS